METPITRVAADDAPVQAHIDVAAGEDEHRWAAYADLAGKQRADADGAGALDDLTLLGIGMANPCRDLVLGKQDDVVEPVPAHGKGQPVVDADAAAERVRQRRQFLDQHRPAGIEAHLHRRAARHRETDDFRGRADALDCRGNTCSQPTTGERD